MLLKTFSSLVLFSIFSLNFGIVIGEPQVDRLKLIADNVNIGDVSEALKETPPQAYQDKDEAPKVVGTLLIDPGLFSGLKSNAMELLENGKDDTDGKEDHQDFFNKPIALFDKITSTVVEKPLKDGRNDEATPNQDENSTSLLEKSAGTTGKITDMYKDSESVGKTTENDKNLSIFKKLESSLPKDHLDQIGNPGKLKDFLTNLIEPASNLENIKSKKLEGFEKVKELTEDIAEDHLAGLGNAREVLDSSSILKTPASFLENLKSGSLDGFAKDKDLKNVDDSSHIKNSLSLFDGIKSLSKDNLENVFREQEIENITSKVDDNSSITHYSLESSAKQLGLSGDKVDVKNSLEIGTESKLLGNSKYLSRTAVESEVVMGKLGLKFKGEVKNRKNENETEEDKPKENINESQDAKKILKNWDININIFDKLKSKDADEEVGQDSNEDNEKNFPKLEESSNEKNIFSLQDLRVFSAPDIDYKISSKMNEQKDDIKNSTQIESDDKDLLDSQSDSFLKRMINRIVSWFKFLIKVVKAYCIIREKLSDSNKEISPQHLKMFSGSETTDLKYNSAAQDMVDSEDGNMLQKIIRGIIFWVEFFIDVVRIFLPIEEESGGNKETLGEKRVFLPEDLQVFSKKIDDEINSGIDMVKEKVSLNGQDSDSSENESFFIRLMKKVIFLE